ncbi:hypothetical protein CWE09_07340 [Aliidiomarina minuta]|uniref:Uncharacterized protein n=1 Tax=Aliidiomarina minuta TaxID=880057 RepID=A0A432W8N9_9GAMM|nr:hypothetical protein [Aliidiomarina minuta]RUO26513.1 hypothetical protein CWE09_07340 [Aliidiomarina minuta]
MSKQTPANDVIKIKHRLTAVLSRSEIPLVVYLVIFLTMALLWIFQTIHEELTLGLFTELLGAAFTLFIIDTLLVRAKSKRWKMVRTHVDYLIARNVNRLRDGIATRVFGFNPGIDVALSQTAMIKVIRGQRAELLNKLERSGESDVLHGVDERTVFSEDVYTYFNEKADDLWEIINMKYSEYMEPELVSLLMRLHTQMKDTCAHIRQYRKGEIFSQSEAHYHQVGRLGLSVSMHEIIRILNTLKENGYSEPPSLAQSNGSHH